MNSFAEHYFEQIQSVSSAIDFPVATRAGTMLIQTWQEGGRIYVAGNGGSAATASHFVCDLCKLTVAEGMPRVKALCLSDNVPLLTAWSNDNSYADAFARQVEEVLQPNDAVVCISGSGNSQNVLRLASYARSQNVRSIGLVGFAGGELRNAVDLAVIIPSSNMQVIEDLHLATCHMISSLLRDAIRKTMSAMVAESETAAEREKNGPM